MKHDAAFYEGLALQAHENSAQFDPNGAPAKWWLEASTKWATLAVAAATLEAQRPPGVDAEAVVKAMRDAERQYPDNHPLSDARSEA